MNDKHEMMHAAPFLKEDHSEDDMTHHEEKEERVEIRDPWSDLLFGRRPISSNHSKETSEENTEENDEE